MIVYQPGDLDMSLAQLWAILRTGEELGELFYSPPSLGTFIEHFKYPQERPLLIDFDSQNTVWFAGWFDRFFDSALLSLWVREDRRKSKILREAFTHLSLWGFERYGGRFFGTTRQPTLLPLHEHLGYEILTKVDHLWGGQDTWLMVLNSETLFVDQRVVEAKHGRR